MLSLAMKNGILIILIILILHFLLKNYLVENKSVKYNNVYHEPSVIPVIDSTPPPIPPVQAVPIVIDTLTVDKEKEKNNDADEIYKFLFTESTESTAPTFKKDDIKTSGSSTSTVPLSHKYMTVGEYQETKPLFEDFSGLGGFESFGSQYEEIMSKN